MLKVIIYPKIPATFNIPAVTKWDLRFHFVLCPPDVRGAAVA